MILEPRILHIFVICQLAVDLHPSVSKRDVLKIHKSGSHTRHWACVAREHKVATAQLGIYHLIAMLLHAHREGHAAIFQFAIQLLQPCARGVLCIFHPFSRLVAMITHIRGPSTPHFEPESVAKALCGVHSMTHTGTHKRRIGLRDGAITVCHNVMRRQMTVSGIYGNFCLIIDLTLRFRALRQYQNGHNDRYIQ